MNHDERATVISDWWNTHLRARHADDVTIWQRSRAREISARLRRAQTVEALLVPEVHELSARLFRGRDLAARVQQIADLTRFLAHVRKDHPETLARRMGRVAAENARKRYSKDGKDKETRPNDPFALRFERMIRAEDFELSDQIIRLLPLVEHSCNVGRLGADFLNWTDRKKSDWCFDYFKKQNDRQDIGSGEDKT